MDMYIKPHVKDWKRCQNDFYFSVTVKRASPLYPNVVYIIIITNSRVLARDAGVLHQLDVDVDVTSVTTHVHVYQIYRSTDVYAKQGVKCELVSSTSFSTSYWKLHLFTSSFLMVFSKKLDVDRHKHFSFTLRRLSYTVYIL